MPLLLIDCDPTPETRAYYDALSAFIPFDILDWPTRQHGKALDQLFLETRDEVLLLVDSDAEIRSGEYITDRRWFMDNYEGVFAAGFSQGPSWMSTSDGTDAEGAIYQERPWMPCVMFRVSHVRAAIEQGISFMHRQVDADRSIPTDFGEQVTPRRVTLTFCDTGADIFQFCRYQMSKMFAGIPVQFNEGEVAHYHGVTRAIVTGQQANAADLDKVADEVSGRLAEEYDLNFSDVIERATES